MKRVVFAAVAVCVGAYAVWAASPQVESAIQAFKSVASDNGKLTTFCAMSKAMDAAGEKEDPAAETKIMAMMKQLGPDFEAAWNAGDSLDDNSDDGKAYGAAIDDLAQKCPQ